MALPEDYFERVYAGVLGKLIGVYLGRPFEGWTYARITAELGEVRGYVHERLGVPLVVTDDDLAGTFTFLRALEDAGFPPDLSPAQVGEAWLNYIVPGRTVLWWGGVGNSTEHTAYLNLRDGVPAPESGSAARNGKVVSEQIGAQIFVDGWAMLAPGDPARAADLARRAASVSHDGEAVYGAQALAAMEALAFVEPRLDPLLDAAVAVIPPDSVIAQLYADMRAWRAAEPDWRRARERVEGRYGYHIYGGNCHVVPNHALILLGLLYGRDFHEALSIVCTAGWDTDCNAGNLGCLLAIRGGLAALEGGPDWRGPVADRLYLPTADPGRCVTDAAAEALAVANAGRRLAGLPPLAPKGGARFHFVLPGSLQGFQPDPAGAPLALANVAGPSGERGLAIACGPLAPGQAARALTPTFIPLGTPPMPSYDLLASPTLASGQLVRARVRADPGNAGPLAAALAVGAYGPEDAPQTLAGPAAMLEPGEARELSWRVPDTGGAPTYAVGVELREAPAGGALHLEALTWHGVPELRLTRPAAGGEMWRRAWVDAVDRWKPDWPEPFRIIQNRGRGLLIHGAREWGDYAAEADVTPHLAEAAGIAVRVQGLRRYYALLLRRPGLLQLVKLLGGESILAQVHFPWELGATFTLRLAARGPDLQAWAAPGAAPIPADLAPMLSARDGDSPLLGGGIALVVEQGRSATQAVAITPLGGQ